jgi:hypothetical protein
MCARVSVHASVLVSASVCVMVRVRLGLSFLHILKDERGGWGDGRYWRDVLKGALKLLKAGSTGALLPSKVG